jgi:hypothetical protein
MFAMGRTPLIPCRLSSRRPAPFLPPYKRPPGPRLFLCHVHNASASHLFHNNSQSTPPHFPSDASLPGVVVSSIDLLPSGRLSGGRIAQALFGRQIARRISFTTNLLLGLGGLSGSVLCLAVGFIALFFRGGEELPAKDEITPVAPWR